jgi:RimJ/RimL family protein N-acetyltransferase
VSEQAVQTQPPSQPLPQPLATVTLQRDDVRLEPMKGEHAAALADAARDGELWNLSFTTVPTPDGCAAYIADALRGLAAGTMLPWVVRDLRSDTIVGSTRYHDIVAAIGRVEIGYTWYAARFQRTHVNTTCKLLLRQHAFDTLGCGVVGLRTDRENTRSQAAIERLGAHRDGVLRHFQARKDGSPRDTVMYSILRDEWPALRDRLERRLASAAGNV